MTGLSAFLPDRRSVVLLLEATRTGLGEIWAHKLRSVLTLFGVTMGVFGLILIFSLFRGLKVSLAKILSEGGWSKIVYVYTAPPENEKGRAWLAGWKGLTYEDAVALRETDVCAAVTAGMNHNATVRREAREYRTDVVGVDTHYLAVHVDRKLVEGRWIAESEIDGRARVAIVGRKLQEELFPSGALGEEIRFEDVRLKIVGVLEKPKGMMDEDIGYDDERACYLPISTVASYFRGGVRPDNIQVRIQDGVSPGVAVQEVQDTLLRRHGGVPDFSEFNIAEFLLRISKTLDEILRNLDIVFGAIAGTSLLVGGLGIVSVLLIAIRERIFEIGVRKAVGATDRDLVAQLLVESVALTAIGAAVGSALSYALTAVLSVVLRQVLPTGLPFSVPGMLLACLFAAAVGLFSGLYPAILAGRMKPVDALSGTL